MAKQPCGSLPGDVASPLRSSERPAPAAVYAHGEPSLVLNEELLARLPALLSPAQAATWLGVSTETVNRRIRQGKQQAVEVLGITRIPAGSAIAQVRAQIIDRLPPRYRKSKRPGTAPPSARDDESAPPIPHAGS